MSTEPAWLAAEVARDAFSSRGLTLRELLAASAPEALAAITAAAARASAARAMALTPVVGVCGMMNSGKSTLVASLLSPEGRRRVLIGIGPGEGTHRFVLWVPEAWRTDAARAEALARLIETTFGHPGEPLATEPTEALAQINAREDRAARFGVPLIGYDPELNRHQLALLDTPDIQRSHDTASREETARLREEALARAARLCSAFLVVTRLDAVEDERLTRLIALLEAGRLPLYAVITKLPPAYHAQAAGMLAQELEAKGLAGQLSGTFLSPYLAGATPDAFPEGVCYEDAAGRFPSLAEALQTLDPARLQHDFHQEKEAELLRAAHAAWEPLRAREAAQGERFHRARSGLLGFLAERFVDDQGRLRSLYSAEVTGALLESFVRTAPWYLKPMMRLHRRLFEFIADLRNVAVDHGGRLLKFLRRRPFEHGPSPEMERLTQISPGQFATALLGSHWLPSETDRPTLETLWNTALGTMLSSTIAQPETLRSGLDEATQAIWAEAGVWRKVLTAGSFLLTLAGALAAVLALPLDGGLSTVYSATIAELFSAVGLAILVQGAAVHSLENRLEALAARPQLTALFALLQDGLGIPRADAAALAGLEKENRPLRLEPYAGEGRLEPLCPVAEPPVYHLVKTPPFLPLP